jgi:transposase
MGFEFILDFLARYFGKRGSKIVVCLVLMAFGLKNQEIKNKFGMSYDSLRKYREAFDAKNVEPLFLNAAGSGKESELERYKDKILDDFKVNPPQTLRDAQERILKLTGIKRSINRIRIFLLKRGFAAGL